MQNFPIKTVQGKRDFQKIATEVTCQKFTETINIFLNQTNKPGMIIVAERDSELVENIPPEKDTFNVKVLFGRRKFDEDNEIFVEEIIIRNLIQSFQKTWKIILWCGLKKDYIFKLKEKEEMENLMKFVKETCKKLF